MPIKPNIQPEPGQYPGPSVSNQPPLKIVQTPVKLVPVPTRKFPSRKGK